MNNVPPKYRLPGKDGGFFFKDDAQLKRGAQPWMRWLPCWMLWKIAVWMYYR